MAVRRERVLIEVESDLAPTVLRDATAVALLNRELNSLSGQSVKSARASQAIARDTDNMTRSATKADGSINQLTGRLRLMAEISAILGPALLPIAAVGVPALAGLAAQAGAAALAGGTMIIAFQGVFDALKLVNTAALEPTTENLRAAREAMRALSPEARQMVRELQELRPVLQGLRDAAAGGLFPGLIKGIDELESRADDVERILERIGAATGELFADAGESLASDRWDEFFAFLATEVPATISALGHAVGDLTHGMAELWMAFDPLSDDFSSWLMDVADGFDRWAQGLDQTEGFQEFVDYVRSSGPQVASAMGAIADAIIQVAQAAAPLGGPVLRGIEAFAKVVAAIADSNLGAPIMTAVAALALLSRGMKVYESMSGVFDRSRTKFLGVADSLGTVVSAQDRARMSAAELDAQVKRTHGSLSVLGAGLGFAAALEGLNLLDDALDDLFNSDFESSNLNRSLEALSSGEVTGAIADTWGEDLKGLNYDLDTLDNNLTKIRDYPGMIFPGSVTQLEGARDRIRQIDDALAGMVESGQKAQAARIFDTLIAKAAEGGNSVEQLRDAFEQYDIALDNARKGTSWLGDAISGLIPHLKKDTDATRDNTDSQRDNAAALSEVRQQRLRNQNAMLNWRETVLDATKAARENSNVLAGNGEILQGQQRAGIEARRTLVDIAAAWNDQSKAVRGSKQEQQDAIGTFVAVAHQMGMNEDAARRYALRLLDIPPKRETKVSVPGAAESTRQILGLRTQIDLLHGKEITITTVRRNVYADGNSSHAAVGYGSGGTYAAGGYTGAGGKYEPAGIVHRREVVLPDYIVDRDASFLKSRYGFLPGMAGLPGYAEGGLVGSTRAGSYLDLSLAELGVSTFARTLDRATRATSDHERATRGDEKANRSHEQAVKAAERAVTEHEKALDEARQVVQETRDALQQLKDRAKAFGDAVAGNFTGDPWYEADPENGFSASEALLLSLKNQAISANYFQQLLEQAQIKGLNGGLFNYLSQTGDVDLLQEIAGMTRQQIREYEQAYGARGRETRELGDYASNQRYGEDIRDQTRELAKQTRELQDVRQELHHLKDEVRDLNRTGPRRTGEAVGDALNHAAADSARRPR